MVLMKKIVLLFMLIGDRNNKQKLVGGVLSERK